MENGRSPLLGSGLSESEGTELMEGAAASVGRKQSLSTITALFLSILLQHLTVFMSLFDLLRLSGLSAAK